MCQGREFLAVSRDRLGGSKDGMHVCFVWTTDHQERDGTSRCKRVLALTRDHGTADAWGAAS
jgi:hypothetical protein